MQTLPTINNQLSHKGLFDAFKIQLAKDFKQSNFPSDFIETLEPNYAVIHEQIVLELQRCEKKSDVKIMRLLNRVDIGEAQLEKYLQAHKNENHYTVIAELIIKRILQKVVIKQYYTNNEKS